MAPKIKTDSPGAASIEAPAAADQSQSPDDLVRIYNRAPKPYTHEVYENDAAKRPAIKYVAAPNAFVTVPRWLAEKWVGMFPEDLLPGDSALKAIDPSKAAFLAVTDKNKELEAAKAGLEAELADLRAQIAGQ